MNHTWVAGLAAAGAGLVAGCLPAPMNVGYVDLASARRGAVDVQGQVGGGGEIVLEQWGAAGAVSVEPFVTPRLSLPVGMGGGVVGTGTESVLGVVPLRVGIRHRTFPHLAFGAGAGPVAELSKYGLHMLGAADVELVAGHRWTRLGLSVGIRPAFTFDPGVFSLAGIIEPQLAIPLGPVALTTGALGGPYVTRTGHDTFVGAFFGATVGVFRRF